MIIRWLEIAAHDIERLFEYIVERNPGAAEAEVHKILEAVEGLADHPAKGRAGRVLGTRELIVASVIVAYRVKGDVVEILRVLHCRRRWPDEF